MADAGRPAGVRSGLVAIAVIGAPAVAVMGVGAAAVAAELANTWDYYFLFERTVAAATPVIAGLLALAFLAAAVVVARA